MMISSTSDETILPNAAPMITPTASSMTGPFIANSLNSFNIKPPCPFVRGHNHEAGYMAGTLIKSMGKLVSAIDELNLPTFHFFRRIDQYNRNTPYDATLFF